MLLEALYPLLTGNTGLVAALPGGIFQSSLPEGACRPAMTYGVAGGSAQQTLDTSGAQKVRIQFDAYGVSRVQAANALDLLRQFFNGYQGDLGNGLHIDNVELLTPEPNDFPVEEYPRDFRCMAEYYVYFDFAD